ncbi:P antigen family member 4 [Ursus maritimus]|uniref:P antigen family member 4 n=1 Tax=Ursus maritimus TaxID=29073 RepID=A0A8M1FZ64_URSMA|nr:P antigen family member 4 [Ursus maritimus]XP_040487526.1 P antigen family member 4 [Ursus maritimus]
MSARVRSRSRGKGDGKKPSKLDEPGVAKQPGKKTPQRKEPPTEDPDIETGRERRSRVVQEPELEGESQEKCLEKTGGERGDGSDVKGKTPSKVAPAKIQDTVYVLGDGQS